MTDADGNGALALASTNMVLIALMGTLCRACRTCGRYNTWRAVWPVANVPTHNTLATRSVTTQTSLQVFSSNVWNVLG